MKCLGEQWSDAAAAAAGCDVPPLVELGVLCCLTEIKERCQGMVSTETKTERDKFFTHYTSKCLQSISFTYKYRKVPTEIECYIWRA